jgi:hypothetical protein
VRSRLLLTLFLLIAVIGLALLLIYGGDKKPEQAVVSLTTLAPDSIQQIRIMRAGEGEILFEKQSGLWMMRAPYQLRASDHRIKSILNLLGAHSYAQFPGKDVQLSRFMLDQPQVSLEFNGERIAFGDVNPLGDQRYVLYNGIVHIINDALFQQLQSPAFFFLNTRLLPEPVMINAILFPGQKFRRQQGVWLVEPESGISADKIVELANAWRDADAISVTKFEAAATHGKIRIELDKQDAIEFTIVREPPQLILARPDLGIQYHLGDYDAERMFLKTTSPEQKQDTSAE